MIHAQATFLFPCLNEQGCTANRQRRRYGEILSLDSTMFIERPLSDIDFMRSLIGLQSSNRLR